MQIKASGPAVKAGLILLLSMLQNDVLTFHTLQLHEVKIVLIKINEININPGRREASEESIEELVRSISEIGLLNPITIDQEYTLIAGLHRLEAAKRLGWTEIECNVCNLDALQTELSEIEENVVRTALSVL